MIDVGLFIQITFIICVEISVLVFLYKSFIARWNSEKAFQVWKSKVTSEEDTTFREILEPIVMEISESVAEYVVGSLEHRYRQQLGTLSRSASAPSNQSDLTQGMMMAESVLKSMGLKSPSIALIGQLMTGLMGMQGDSGGNKEKLF